MTISLCRTTTKYYNNRNLKTYKALLKSQRHQLIHERFYESKGGFPKGVKRNSGPISRIPGGELFKVIYFYFIYLNKSYLVTNHHFLELKHHSSECIAVSKHLKFAITSSGNKHRGNYCTNPKTNNL